MGAGMFVLLRDISDLGCGAVRISGGWQWAAANTGGGASRQGLIQRARRVVTKHSDHKKWENFGMVNNLEAQTPGFQNQPSFV
ncbi:hypothetical protein IMZ48_04100 [Candidatus Bathyarchaeota archaeon]|nr:hypothetical protein [Candidatus Bathyarchaeota archaeon]